MKNLTPIGTSLIRHLGSGNLGSPLSAGEFNRPPVNAYPIATFIHFGPKSFSQLEVEWQECSRMEHINYLLALTSVFRNKKRSSHDIRRKVHIPFSHMDAFIYALRKHRTDPNNMRKLAQCTYTLFRYNACTAFETVSGGLRIYETLSTRPAAFAASVKPLERRMRARKESRELAGEVLIASEWIEAFFDCFKRFLECHAATIEKEMRSTRGR